MADVGRNDPCPCGSGKKYKHCHWRIDQQIQRQNVKLDRAWRTLGQRIREFGIQEHMAIEYVSAWELFWDNKLPPQAATSLDIFERLRFIDWYIYDYRSSRNRKRIAELFLEEQGSELTSLEQELVREWTETHLSAYTILEISGDSIEMQDVFTDEERTVVQPDLAEPPMVDLTLIGRLLPLGGSLRLAPGVTPLSPEQNEDELLGFIQPRYKAWQQARYGADWDDFLGEAGYLLNHFLIQDMEPMEMPEAELPEMPAPEAARSIARRMQGEIITSNLAAHYDRWLDKSIPEWGGKTPREMTASPEDIEKVEVFLDLLEEMEEDRAESGQPTFDVDLLRRKLGLETEGWSEGGIVLPG